MDVKLNQLENIIRKSKCAICGLLLSVGPLMGLSEDGSQIRCGRCKEIKSQTFARNILYENIAAALTFPCTYKKCKQGIPWRQVEEHEKACPFRTVHCPLYYQKCNNCIIEVANLQAHFAQAHRGRLKLRNISFNLPIHQFVIFLLVVEDLKFLVHLSNETNIVFALDPLDKFTEYNVQIRSDKNEHVCVSCLNQQIIQYNEKEHCFKCRRKRCALEFHPYSQALKNAASFDWETISHKFDNSLIELLGNPKQLLITVDLIADQKPQSSEAYTHTPSFQSCEPEDELNGAAVDEKREKIDLR